MLNTNALNKLIEYLDETDRPFSMRNWYICIAAHVLYATGHDPSIMQPLDIVNLARSTLELSADETSKLFLRGAHVNDPRFRLDRTQIVDQLRRIRDTGVVRLEA